MKKTTTIIISLTLIFGIMVQPVNAKSIQKNTWEYLRSIGCSKQATAGIMGNIQQESSFNLRCGGYCKGLFQLSPYNLKRQKKYARKHCLGVWSFTAQMGFATKKLCKELKPYAGISWKKYKKIKSVRKATILWEKGVERAGKPMMGKRIKYAKKFYKKYKEV